MYTCHSCPASSPAGPGSSPRAVQGPGTLWDAGGNRCWLDRASHGADILGDGTAVFGHGAVPCTEPTLTLSPLGFAEQNLERQVLQTQCRRLEAQHYSLSLTAEQLSHSMAVSGAAAPSFCEAPKSSWSTPIHLAVPHPLQYPIPCNSPSPAIPHSHQCPPPRHPTSHPVEHPGEPSIPRGIPSLQPWPGGCPSPALTVSSHLHCLQELRTQKQKMVSERERLQAELDHLRKCLALPAMQWSRGYFKGYPR